MTTNVNFYKGDVLAITGTTLWNGAVSVLAIDSLSTFDILTTQLASAVATAANSTVLIVDSNKNWVVDEHIGKLVKLDTVGFQPTTQLRRIVSNTASTITVATITVAGN